MQSALNQVNRPVLPGIDVSQEIRMHRIWCQMALNGFVCSSQVLRVRVFGIVGANCLSCLYRRLAVSPEQMVANRRTLRRSHMCQQFVRGLLSTGMHVV